MSQLELPAMPGRIYTAFMDVEDLDLAKMLQLQLTEVIGVCPNLIRNGGALKWTMKNAMDNSIPEGVHRLVVQDASEEDCRQYMLVVKKLLKSYNRFTGAEHIVRFKMA